MNAESHIAIGFQRLAARLSLLWLKIQSSVSRNMTQEVWLVVFYQLMLICVTAEPVCLLLAPNLTFQCGEMFDSDDVNYVLHYLDMHSVSEETLMKRNIPIVNVRRVVLRLWIFRPFFSVSRSCECKIKVKVMCQYLKNAPRNGRKDLES